MNYQKQYSLYTSINNNTKDKINAMHQTTQKLTQYEEKIQEL